MARRRKSSATFRHFCAAKPNFLSRSVSRSRALTLREAARPRGSKGTNGSSTGTRSGVPVPNCPGPPSPSSPAPARNAMTASRCSSSPTRRRDCTSRRCRRLFARAWARPNSSWTRCVYPRTLCSAKSARAGTISANISIWSGSVLRPRRLAMRERRLMTPKNI